MDFREICWWGDVIQKASGGAGPVVRQAHQPPAGPEPAEGSKGRRATVRREKVKKAGRDVGAGEVMFQEGDVPPIMKGWPTTKK
jgi:hypothetical protein